MKTIESADGLFRRSVPEFDDLMQFRQWHLSAGHEEPVFILNPRTFTDFASTLAHYTGASHPELGEGLMAFAVEGGVLRPVQVFPDESVDEGVIEVVRERWHEPE